MPDWIPIQTTDFLSCDNMTVRGYKKTLIFTVWCAIIQSQAKETRNEKSRTAKPDRTGGAANKSETP